MGFPSRIAALAFAAVACTSVLATQASSAGAAEKPAAASGSVTPAIGGCPISHTGDTTFIHADFYSCVFDGVLNSAYARLNNVSLYGHFEFWGSNGYHFNGNDQVWNAGQLSFANAFFYELGYPATICDRFWFWTGSGYAKYGGDNCASWG